MKARTPARAALLATAHFIASPFRRTERAALRFECGPPLNDKHRRDVWRKADIERHLEPARDTVQVDGGRFGREGAARSRAGNVRCA